MYPSRDVTFHLKLMHSLASPVKRTIRRESRRVVTVANLNIQIRCSGWAQNLETPYCHLVTLVWAMSLKPIPIPSEMPAQG